MRKIVVTTFLSLDGIMEEPQWTFPYWSDEIAKFKYEELFASDALLLGRVTYEGFAQAWPGRTDEQGFGDRMNNMTKYVVTNTLQTVGWTNSTIVKGDIPAEIQKLKQQDGMDILVDGSAMLVQLLIQHNLVDVYRLLIYPVVLGKGKRLFQEGATDAFKLVQSQGFASGVIGAIYTPDPDKKK